MGDVVSIKTKRGSVKMRAYVTDKIMKGFVYAPVGGENFLDQTVPVDIRWTWVGTAWQVGDTARLEYSADSGQHSGVVAQKSCIIFGNMFKSRCLVPDLKNLLQSHMAWFILANTQTYK